MTANIKEAELGNNGLEAGEAAAGALTPVPPVIEESPKPQEDIKAGNPALLFLQLLCFGSTVVDAALIAVGTLCAIASGIPFPLMAILFGQLLNDLNDATCAAGTSQGAGQYEKSINSKILTLIYIAIGYFVLTFINIVSWNLVSQRLAQRLRERYFQSLLRQEQSFFDKRHAGDVSSRLNADIQAVQSGTCEKVGIFIGSMSFFVTAYVVAFIKEAKLAGMLISLIPAFLLVAIIGGGYTQKFTVRVAESIAAASSIASEALSHIAVVEAFGAGPRLEKRFAQHMASACGDGIKKGMAVGVQAGFLYFIAYSANALAYWQGSRMIANLVAGRDGGSSIGEIYTVVFIIVDACIVLGSAAPLLPLFGGASAAFERLKKDMDHQSLLDGTSDSGQRLAPESLGTIEFRNVTFAYPSRPNDPVLKNVDLSFPAGKFTAIVGPSGSGKSTVAGLIARLHDPLEGAVVFDNQPLTELNLRSLRAFISLVQQEPSLLDRSILENIALGLVNSPLAADDKVREVLLSSRLEEIAAEARNLKSLPKIHDPVVSEVVERACHAAELADAAEFIGKLEHGYGTLVGSLGKSVSGGQRQRISLARALVRNPKILILDEATASLDSASEQRIQAAFDRVTKDRTVISIAHRLSTIKHADNIIVLKAGEVVEQGTYDELVSKNGVFAGMASLQALGSSERNESSSRASTEVDSIDFATEKSEVHREQSHAGNSSDVQDSNSESAKEAGLDENQSFRQVLKAIGKYVRPNYAWLFSGMFSAAIVGLTFIASGLILGHTVGALNPCSTTVDRILYLGKLFGGMLFMLAVVEFFANFSSWASFGVIAERLLYTVRVLSFRSLFEQSVEWHQSSDRDSSMLLSVITKDTAALGGFSGSIMGTIFSILVNFFVAIIVSHIIAWKLAIVCLTMMPILLGSGVMQIRSLSRYEDRHAKAFAKSVSITVEAVNSMKTIATLSLEDEVMGTYSRVLSASKKDVIGASIYTNLWLALSISTGFFVYAFAYWWGGRLITKGEYTQQQFFIVIIAMLVSAQLWGQMFTLAPEVSRSRASASRILSLIQAGSGNDSKLDDEDQSGPSTEKDIEALAESTHSPPSSSGSRGVNIAFTNVNFSYSNSSSILALKDATFTVQPGQFIGLVGPSGAGKSTIMNLVQGMYTPTSGTVKLDDVPVSKRNFRDDIAIVPQDNALFNGTIKFNVSLGARPNQEATDAEIEEACKIANIHDTIMSLPKGYDTEVGPNGSQLSGGQRQRLTIARALVRKPRLLLLDESTSALDADSEMALQKGLERVVRSEGITVLAITHRLHTVVRADCILVVEGGKVVDKGRHEELVSRRESYRDNATHQMLQ